MEFGLGLGGEEYQLNVLLVDRVDSTAILVMVLCIFEVLEGWNPFLSGIRSHGWQIT
jgi:hypothetical protein